MEPLPMAAVHHPPGETLEVFAADDDGAVKVAWKRRNEPWQPPHALTLDSFLPSGCPVAAAGASQLYSKAGIRFQAYAASFSCLRDVFHLLLA